MFGNSTSIRAAVFVYDARKNDEKCNTAHDVDAGISFVGVIDEEYAGAVEAFDEEGESEGQEERISRSPPEAQEEQRRSQGRGGDDAEQEAFNHQRSPSQISP